MYAAPPDLIARVSSATPSPVLVVLVTAHTAAAEDFELGTHHSLNGAAHVQNAGLRLRPSLESQTETSESSR